MVVAVVSGVGLGGGVGDSVADGVRVGLVTTVGGTVIGRVDVEAGAEVAEGPHPAQPTIATIAIKPTTKVFITFPP